MRLTLRAIADTLVIAGLLVLLDPGTFGGRVWMAFGAFVVVAALVTDERLATMQRDGRVL